MSFPLTTRFGADPLLDLEIANKQYVDASGGAWTFVFKTADETRTSDTTLSDDTELFFPVVVDGVYYAWFFLEILNDAAADIKLNMTQPTNCAGQRLNATWGSQVLIDGEDITVQRAMATATGIKFVVWPMIIKVGDTAGNIQLQWAQNTASPNVETINRGSYIAFSKLN